MRTKILALLFMHCLAIAQMSAQANQDTISLKWWQGLDPEWQRYFTDAAELDSNIDASDLKKISRLNAIDIRGYVIYELTPLQALSQRVVYLNMSGTFISSLEPLRGMSQLSTLICDSVNTLKSIEPLIDLTSLSALRLVKTSVPNDEIKKLRATRKDLAIMYR
jgi:hypothetical protein